MVCERYATLVLVVDSPVFHSQRIGQVATLSTNEAAILNESVEKALEVKGKRGKYNRYSPEDRTEIGTYAVENGPSKAVWHYSKITIQL